MAVIVPEGEGTAQFVFNAVGVTKDCTWGVGLGDTSDFDDLTALANLIFEAFTLTEEPEGVPYEAASFINAWAFSKVVVTFMTPTGPLSGESTNAPISGTITEGGLPVNCSLLLTKETGLGGRKFKGRAYIPPLAPDEEGVTVNGQMDGGTRLNIESRYSTAFTQMGVVGAVPVLHHSDGSPGTLITGVSLSGTIGTQRRRLR